MISFGVAPAFIMYFWKLNTLGKFGWLVCLIFVICVALRLARFNINSGQESSWKDNFFEGVPSPAGGILVLTPLIFSMTNFEFIQINYEIFVPIFFIVTSLLLISKFPSYSFKKIVIQRKTTIFLLFGIVLFFGLLLIYPFNVITISALIYLAMLPISYFHYQKNSIKNLTKQLETLSVISILNDKSKNIIKDQDVNGIKLRFQKVDDLPPKELRKLVDQGKKDLSEGIVIVFASKDDKVGIAVGITESLIGKYDAVEFVKIGSEIIGGKGGGGRKDFAQAGGQDQSKIEAAFEKLKALI